MSRGDGFANADLDTGIARDQKFRRLARLHPELVVQAFAGYIGVLAESWGCGQRLTAADAWPEIIPWSEDAVAALKEAELLDGTARIPIRVWKGWFGVAFARRELRRQAGAIGGKHKSSNAKAQLELSLSDALPVPSVPTVKRTTPQPPASGGPKKRPRRTNGDTPRAKGTSPRQVLEGSPMSDAKALASLEERTTAWNAAHPSDPIDWIGGSEP